MGVDGRGGTKLHSLTYFTDCRGIPLVQNTGLDIFQNLLLFRCDFTLTHSNLHIINFPDHSQVSSNQNQSQDAGVKMNFVPNRY
jgi:hypothetical protein